jgi:hypothetical protein
MTSFVDIYDDILARVLSSESSEPTDSAELLELVHTDGIIN